MRQIIHIALALMVGIGSTGLVFSKHYCQGELKSFALFRKATPCYAKQGKSACPHHPNGQHDPDKGCCKDTVEWYQSDDWQWFDAIQLFPLPPLPVLAVLVPTQAPLQDRLLSPVHYLNYKPPLLAGTIRCRLQVWRC